MISQMVKVCGLSELSEGKARCFLVGGREIVLAMDQGKIYAFDDICTHDGGNLNEGAIIDGQIECPRHGARFDIKTGKASRMPAIFGIRTYEIKIENDQVFIEIGE